MLHEGNALRLETFALFAHPDAYRSIPSHRSTWGISVEEGEEVLVVLFGFLSFFFNFYWGWGGGEHASLWKRCSSTGLAKLLLQHKYKSPGKFKAG